MKAGRPTFPELPALVAAGDTAARLACSKTGPGTIPPPGSVHLPPAQRLQIRSAKMSRRLRGVVVELRTNFGTMRGIEVELRHGHRILARRRVRFAGTKLHRVLLRARGGLPPAGRYTIVVRHRGRVVAEHGVTVKLRRRDRQSLGIRT